MSLVSVVICTFNSGKYITETLESIAIQSYDDIELILTDDASKDETLSIIKHWLSYSDNGRRLKDVRILESEVNTGISANANRGLKVATGQWVKFLGADDTMLPDCISDNMQYVNENDDIKVLFSKINIYKDTFTDPNFIISTPIEVNQDSILWPGRNSLSQYKMLLQADRIHFSPSAFIHRDTLLSVGGFDERFRLLEDYPLWLNLTRNGNKLYFMDKVTVNYRQHSKAINNTGENYLVNPNYFRHQNFRKIYTYPFLPIDIRLYQRFNWYVLQLFRCNYLNRRNRASIFLQSLLTIYLNPFKYLIWFRRRLGRNLGFNEFYL